MDGKDEPSNGRGLRPAVPHPDGPLSRSGAAPDPALSPVEAPTADAPPLDAPPTDAPPTDAPVGDTTIADTRATDATTASATTASATTASATTADTATADTATADTATADTAIIEAATAGAATADATTVDTRTVDGATAADTTTVDTKAVDATTVDGAPVDTTAADGPASGGRRGRIHPVAAARTTGRATMTWARRPSGRVIVPGVLAVLLVGVAGTAGAYLVPEAIDVRPSTGVTPPFGSGADVPSGAPVPGNSIPGQGIPGQGLPGSGPAGLPPGTTPPAGGAPTGAPGARPADALAGWAQQVGTKVSIPVVAAQAYGYTELVLSRTAPACRLSWTTIAALAKVESDHGSANGSVLGVDGQTQPAIVGLPLDGKGGRQLVPDTDRGALDGDTVFDRAMGPLQFIPATWKQNAVDADNNGTTDPNDIDDAALTAGMYLCRDGRDMSKADEWWNAILSYNNVQPYAQQVFTEANGYGTRSRT